MKKNRLSMNLIMVLAMAAVAVCVLVCAIVIFVQTYRSALLRNAETTSRQAIAQVSSTMEEYLEDMNDSVALLTDEILVRGGEETTQDSGAAGLDFVWCSGD